MLKRQISHKNLKKSINADISLTSPVALIRKYLHQFSYASSQAKAMGG